MRKTAGQRGAKRWRPRRSQITRCEIFSSVNYVYENSTPTDGYNLRYHLLCVLTYLVCGRASWQLGIMYLLHTPLKMNERRKPQMPWIKVKEICLTH